ncbi:MAG TPA: orotidine 5'-phosphate decarboxylase / HUMPS family protein, partial [Thermomicrobiales bacterium]|nr:orotidine 5'-phosphate decarboxylase / HUMPS family protein [Thermomicrobiales bacterium]
MTRLQLAIDLVAPDDFERVVVPLLPLIDVVEAGTPLIKQNGMAAVQALRLLAPNHLLVADMKTM